MSRQGIGTLPPLHVDLPISRSCARAATPAREHCPDTRCRLPATRAVRRARPVEASVGSGAPARARRYGREYPHVAAAERPFILQSSDKQVRTFHTPASTTE